jgi:hypothetical protein
VDECKPLINGLVRRAGVATVVSERGDETRKWPPYPLNTIEMQKRVGPAKILLATSYDATKANQIWILLATSYDAT